MTRLDIERVGRGRVVLAGRELSHFGGCDYLGLSSHPRVLAALEDGLSRYGVSPGASRETSGNAREHEQLEDALARFLGREAAVLLPEGWLADAALAESLAEECDLALVDERAHESLPAAARAAGLRAVSYGHADAVALVRRLDEHRPERPLVLTDGVFPALARCAPVRDILLALPASGVLLLDDCHGLGVLGVRGRGTLEHLGIDDERIALTGTLSKALGCYGGFVAATRARIERVRERSACYVGTTPVPPALAAAAREALALLEEGEVLGRLRANIARLRAGLAQVDLRVPALEHPVVAIEPRTHRDGERLYRGLLDDGFLVPYVRYAGGPAGDGSAGWLRLAVSSAHAPEEIDGLCAALARHRRPTP